MQILFFGTFDERAHPRVRVLREGLADHGHETTTCNAPLGLSTNARVGIARQPWRVPMLVLRLLVRWTQLLVRARGTRPDVVIVGYLGHFDVHLARLRFRRAVIVLDHLVGLGDTVRDRQLDSRRVVVSLLDIIDRAALRAAEVVIVDTEEHADMAGADARGKVVVAGVGAPRAWFDARRPTIDGDELRVVFYGLYTPLQGAPLIGTALRLLHGSPLRCTMIGSGQDLADTRAVVGDDPRITWLDWVDERELPALVAGHHVCLGIFGDSPKARRVVPNKVYQGAAAGCAVVTSDTPPQRRVLGGAAVLVPPGDDGALAATLQRLAAEPAEVQRLRSAAAELADEQFSGRAVVASLNDRLAVSV